MREATNKSGVTTFRLDPDVREMLEAFCAENRRSMNSAVNYLLAQALRTVPAGDDKLELR
jgi:hypothetical protein